MHQHFNIISVILVGVSAHPALPYLVIADFIVDRRVSAAPSLLAYNCTVVI